MKLILVYMAAVFLVRTAAAFGSSQEVISHKRASSYKKFHRKGLSETRPMGTTMSPGMMIPSKHSDCDEASCCVPNVFASDIVPFMTRRRTGTTGIINKKMHHQQTIQVLGVPPMCTRPPMGFALIPFDESVEWLFVSAWNWRPIVAIIESFRIVDEHRVSLMYVQCLSVNTDYITIYEANSIARRIETEVLDGFPPGGRVLLDLSVTTQPDDGKIYLGEEAYKNYGAYEFEVREFVKFCRESGGFEVF